MAIPQAASAINETFGHDDDIFCILRNNAAIQKSESRKLPVVVRCYGADDDTRGKKISTQWLTCYGKTADLPCLDDLPTAPTAHAEDGDGFIHIAGPDIRAGIPTECLVVCKHQMFLRQMVFPAVSLQATRCLKSDETPVTGTIRNR